MTVPVTVAIPVGPLPHNTRWLVECVDSALSQDMQPSELLLINDGGDHAQLAALVPAARIVDIPWPSGVAHAYNYCVGAAANNAVIVVNSDDKLLPGAIVAAWSTYQQVQDTAGYYWFDVQYSTGETQAVCDGCGMPTRELWHLTGGFPIEGAIGGGDWMFISLVHTRGLHSHLHRIAGGPLYWYRQHDETDTNRNRRKGRGDVAKDVLQQLTWEVSA